MQRSRWLALLVLGPLGCGDDGPAGGGSDSGSTSGTTTATTSATGATSADASGSSGSSGGGGSSSSGADGSSSGGEAPPVTLSEIDCHGRDAIELAAPAGTELGGIQIVIDGVVDYTIPDGTVSDGLYVVREATMTEPGLSANLACTEVEVALVLGAATLDATQLPAFPGSFKGTTWCSGVSPDPFALCAPTLTQPNQPYVDPGGVLFDPLAPVEIDLTLDQAGIDALWADPKSYVAGTFSLTKDGVTTPPIDVGIALKGSYIGSFADLDGKAAFKIRFDFVDPTGDFLGLAGLKLNNMREDASQLHEALGYGLFAATGVPAPRAGYAEVRLNGDSYGLHAAIERVDDVWCSRIYPTTLHVYEGTFGLDVNPGREDEFEVDEGDPLDRSDLTALMAITTLPDGQFGDALEAAVHLPAMLPMWASSQWLGHWDGYAAGQNNYELHSNDMGVFDLVPSGLDQTSEYLIDLRTGQSPYQGQGVLFSRCLDDAQCSDAYDAAVVQTGDAIAQWDVQARIDAIVDAIEPWVQADPRRGTSVATVHGAQDDARQFWDARAALMQ